MNKEKILIIAFCFVGLIIWGQRNTSVEVNDPVYYILETAQIRGLCKDLPSTKPYSRNQVKKALYEIKKHKKKLSKYEQKVINQILEDYETPKTGWNWQTGSYFLKKDLPDGPKSQPTLTEGGENSLEEDTPVDQEVKVNKPKHYYSYQTGLGWKTSFNANLSSPNEIGTINKLLVYMKGDISKYFSYQFAFEPGFYQVDENAYTPFSFSKQWDGAVFPPSQLDNFKTSPDVFSFGFEINSELDFSFLDDRIMLRFGRMRRDWGSTDSSLYLNKSARPFLGIEGFAQITDWMSFSFLTGVLEYQYYSSIRADAFEQQRLMSSGLLEFNAKDWLKLSFGSTAVWAKRFELGYPFPANSNYFYQNVIGDFDNLSLFATLNFQVPGWINIYLSAYVDEMNLLVDDFLNKDRNMYALQAGFKLPIPKTPFTQITFQYTKIEPYCYTHPKTEVPWYQTKVRTEYSNNGENLGHYLPPNSDEFLFRLDSMPIPYLKAHFSYSLIRHGADETLGVGNGNNLLDELDYTANLNDAAKNSAFWKDFLKDGVYEWYHTLTLGGSYNFRHFKVPITLGVDYSFIFKNHSDYKDGKQAWINEGQYTNKISNILSLYIKIW